MTVERIPAREHDAPRPRRQQARARTTRNALLRAGRECFVEKGFAETSVNDVVARAGASVGTLYHHFGGKNELFVALYELYQARQEERAAQAVLELRKSGENDPRELFMAGARAFLDGCWQDRDLAALFLAGNGPLGFEVIARSRYRKWVRGNSRLLAVDNQPLGEALTLIVTTAAAEAGRDIALKHSREEAVAYRDEVLRLLRKLTAPD